MLLAGLGSYVGVRVAAEAWREVRARRLQRDARERGANEPDTLRPYVDPARCVCSSLCIKACPESDVLAVIDGRAQLVNSSSCVGHARCVEACPTEAIELVFGSDGRGVEIPQLTRDFQTNVPGIYVAGELGGMGLIANAVSQGAAAGEAALQGARGRGRKTRTNEVDVVVVGAGPAGIAAALKVAEGGGSYLLLEQDEWGGAIRHYPRAHIVMTRAVRFPGYGVVTGRTLTKEQLIGILQAVITSEGLEVAEHERMEAVTGDARGFEVRTSKRTVRCARIILAVGRRGTPRKLEVPGEKQAKVMYSLRDPEDYVGKDILVVGGGDSAVQAALSLAAEGRNEVTLSYRGPELTRPKKANRERLAEAVASGEIRVLWNSRVKSISGQTVLLDHAGEDFEIPNEVVFAMTGGVLPTALLTEMGVAVEFHYGREVRYF